MQRVGVNRVDCQRFLIQRCGLIEMTRQRTRPSHKLVASSECPYCVGTGSVLGYNPKPITTIKGASLTSDGKPQMLYIGAEFCPYCAAMRWSMAVALSKSVYLIFYRRAIPGP